MKRRFAYIDPSTTSFVVACPQCPYWSAIRLSLEDAYEAKAGHDIRVHDVEEARARNAETNWRERHPVTS